MHKRLKEQGIDIKAEYFCPHHPEKGRGRYKKYCNCRKPKIGMLEEAADGLNIDLNKSWMIGDHDTDIEAGKSAGCKTIYILTGHKHNNSIIDADFIANNLVDAANYILAKTNKNSLS